MFLALREIRRGVVRFGLLALAIALLMFLVLFQQALQDGLITSFVGAIRNQSAPVVVYSVDGQRTLQGSIITPPLEEAVRATDGVDAAARLGQGTFTVRVGDGDEDDAAVIGTDDSTLGMPESLTAGRLPADTFEAVGSDGDFSVGDRVEVLAGPGGRPVEIAVVGTAADVQLSVTPTLFTDLGTFEAAVRAANPDASTTLPNAILVRPVEGVTPDALAQRINASSNELDALTRSQAATKTPGVAQVRQSFSVIFLLYGLVVPLVTGLFFLIVTLQKAGALTLLRAVGARAGLLARALLVQVLAITCVGIVAGVALFLPLSGMRVGGLELSFDARAVSLWSALFVVLGLSSALISLRRVLRIDPIEATAGPGVR
ncbi:MAG: ABC transporter permease [Actinobacteria bacterium]|nr:ABC transporter permease [Actinomycetota bacterium]